MFLLIIDPRVDLSRQHALSRPKITEYTDVAKILQPLLSEQLQRQNLPWFYKNAIEKILEKIKKNTIRGLGDITWHHQRLTTENLTSLGFDGLIALEGGEGIDVYTHDSYVIFDLKRVKIVKESKVEATTDTASTE